MTDCGDGSTEIRVGPLVLNMEKYLSLGGIPSSAGHVKVKNAKTSNAIRTNGRSHLVKLNLALSVLPLKICLLSFNTEACPSTALFQQKALTVL